MSTESPISRVGNRLEETEEVLTITITGEALTDLTRISEKMKNITSPKEAVELAIELLIKAEGKDIALMDRGRVSSTYRLWRN